LSIILCKTTRHFASCASSFHTRTCTLHIRTHCCAAFNCSKHTLRRASRNAHKRIHFSPRPGRRILAWMGSLCACCCTANATRIAAPPSLNSDIASSPRESGAMSTVRATASPVYATTALCNQDGGAHRRTCAIPTPHYHLLSIASSRTTSHYVTPPLLRNLARMHTCTAYKRFATRYARCASRCNMRCAVPGLRCCAYLWCRGGLLHMRIAASSSGSYISSSPAACSRSGNIFSVASSASLPLCPAARRSLPPAHPRFTATPHARQKNTRRLALLHTCCLLAS